MKSKLKILFLAQAGGKIKEQGNDAKSVKINNN